VQVSSNDLAEAAKIAAKIRDQVSRIPGVADTYIPEDVDAPSLQLSINRYYAQQMGMSEHEVVSNIITSLTSDGMIAPSYWVDPRSGNLYMLTVQFPDNTVRSLEDLKNMPVRSSSQEDTTALGNLTNLKLIQFPNRGGSLQTAPRHRCVYLDQRRRTRVANAVNQIVDHTQKPGNVVIYVRGIVGAMNSSLQSFGFGLILSLVLVYLVLVAQFRSFVDPFCGAQVIPSGKWLITLKSNGEWDRSGAWNLGNLQGCGFWSRRFFS
jgi:multidrug efflux pump subunit AcrB